MGVSFVQGVYVAGGASVASLAVAFPGNVTSGDLLVAFVDIGSSGGQCTFTDTQLNTWPTQANNSYDTPAGGPTAAHGGAIASSTAACTVTVTFQNTQTNFPELFIAEFNVGGHAVATDGTDATGHDAGTSFQSGSITTTNNPDILICWMSNNGALSSLTAGWTSPAAIFDPGGQGLAYAVVTTPAAYSLAATQPAGGDYSAICAYQASAFNPSVSVNPKIFFP